LPLAVLMLERGSCSMFMDLMAASSGPKKPSASKTSWPGKTNESDQHARGHCEPRRTLLRARHLGHLPRTRMVLRPFDADRVQALKLALVVQDELLGRDAVLARVLAEVGRDLGVAVVDTEDAWPGRPGVVACSACGRLGQEFEVGDRASTVAQGSANAVVSGCAGVSKSSTRR
jgi:hypothetical protein